MGKNSTPELQSRPNILYVIKQEHSNDSKGKNCILLCYRMRNSSKGLEEASHRGLIQYIDRTAGPCGNGVAVE